MPFCTNCGSALPDAGAKFCPTCGAPVLSAGTTSTTTSRRPEALHQTFAVTGRPKITITVRTPGSVDVQRGGAGEVLVDSEIAEAENIAYKASQSGDAVHVTSHGKTWNPLVWGSYIFSAGPRANIRVTAPQEADLSIETITDSITVSGIKGSISAESKTGPIYIRDSEGSLIVRTHTGNVDLNGVSALVDVRNTIGHVNFVGALSPGSNSIRTTTGDIDVALKGEPDLLLDASTNVGRIISRMEMADARFDRGQYIGQHLTGRLGTGRGRLLLEATTGSISIYRQA